MGTFPVILWGGFFCLSLLSCILPPMAHADCVTRFDNGKINWSNGKITATGKAAPKENTESEIESVPGSARANANGHIIEILKQVKIYNGLTVGEYASNNDVILAGIEKTAGDALIVRQTYTSALDIEIEIETSIYGGFLQLTLPDEIRQISEINPEKTEQTGKGLGEFPYTGLILDARGLKVAPVLYPVIVSEQGRKVYSSLFISREFAVQYGACLYLCDIEKAKGHKRTGPRPIILKGLRKSGKNDSSIMIGMKDAKKLEKLQERHQFFKECRVIIVVDGWEE